MVSYTVNNPEFSNSIPITEPEDREHADNINAAPKKLIENDLVLKNRIDGHEEEGIKNPKKLKFTGLESYDGSKEVEWTIECDGYANIEGIGRHVQVPNGLGPEQYVMKYLLRIYVDGENNLVTEEAGKLLDARQGKILNDKITELQSLRRFYGAKNLLKITAETMTQNGITLTVNRNSLGDVTSIVVNGTATCGTEFLIGTVDPCNEQLWLSGSPTANGQIYLKIAAPEISGSENRDIGQGCGYNLSYAGGEVKLGVYYGFTANNITIYPMVRNTLDTDDTYNPYSMTNYMLTKHVDALETAIGGLEFEVTNEGILRITYDDGN